MVGVLSELVQLFERQVRFVRGQKAERVLLMLPRLMAFVAAEPRIAALCDDILTEFNAGLDAFAASDRELSAKLLVLWAEHRSWFEPAWTSLVKGRDSGPLRVWGDPGEKFARLGTRAGKHDLPVHHEPDQDPSAVGEILRSFRHWNARLGQHENDQALLEKRESLSTAVGNIMEAHDRARRTYLVLGRSHAGGALYRLKAFAISLVPDVRVYEQAEDARQRLNKYAATIPQHQISNAALGLGEHRIEIGDTEEYRGQILRDLDTFAEEIAHRVGLHRSHAALIQRFKARCQRFSASRLQREIQIAKDVRPKRNPEDILTLAAAEFLFDHGLNPLVDAAIANLRPDLFDPRDPLSLYVEAKQYSSSPHSTIKKAAWQVWDTWNELDASHTVNEAFLLVFRLGGPLVTFDACAKQGTRTLYPVLIDIAPTAERGSRAKQEPLHVQATDLIPREKGRTRS